jgi:hypothetical protein
MQLETLIRPTPAPTMLNARNALVGMALALGSCGGPENNSEYCQLELTNQLVTVQSAQKFVTLSGDLPTNCETLTRENSGKLIVQVRLVGPKDEDIALNQVQAGSRTKSFDPVASNLKAGSLDASFTSQAEPGWAIPWKDTPNSITVAVLAPLEAKDTELPQRASVRLSL